MKREADLKSLFMHDLRERLPGCVALRHEDRFTNGIPDISVTLNGRTTWWECKHADPRFKSDGIQELTMLRLAAAGYARYIVWHERNGVTRTLIVHPRHLYDLMPELFCVGFDNRWLVEVIRHEHHS